MKVSVTVRSKGPEPVNLASTAIMATSSTRMIGVDRVRKRVERSIISSYSLLCRFRCKQALRSPDQAGDHGTIDEGVAERPRIQRQDDLHQDADCADQNAGNN